MLKFCFSKRKCTLNFNFQIKIRLKFIQINSNKGKQIKSYLRRLCQFVLLLAVIFFAVFDILMKYTECQDWTESLQTGTAKRWGYVPKLGGDSVEGVSPASEVQSLTPSSS